MLKTASLALLVLAAISSGGCARDVTEPGGATGDPSSVSTSGARADTVPSASSGPVAAGATSAGSDPTAASAGTGSGAIDSTGGGSTVGAAATNGPVVTTPPTASTPPASTTPAATAFRGDGSPMPAFGGWSWGNTPAAAIAAAGFDWFETGYPGDTASNDILRSASVRPFAYINLGELDPTLATQANYTGPVLRTNAEWGTQLVDVTDPSWQDWLVRRTEYAYSTGSRGVKWDVASPDVPPGKTRTDVNEAIAAVMKRILALHPDLKFIFNQGFEFALAHPELVHGMETEGLFSASSYPLAFLKPWLDPYYWGPQYQNAKTLRDQGIPIFDAEYTDPSSDTARQLYGAIVAQGFVPYITNATWNIRGWGYNVPAGW